MKKAPLILIFLIFSIVFLYSLSLEAPTPVVIRDYLLEYGAAETGAANLVTSIYLGYRAFDTLGETIVFLVTVAGVIYVIKNSND